MIFDLFRPVPAALAPAFCTKNTSSVGGYLHAPQHHLCSAKAVEEDSPDDSLMKDRIDLATGDNGKGGVGTNYVVESVIVNVKWVCKSLIFRDAWREENLEKS